MTSNEESLLELLANLNLDAGTEEPPGYSPPRTPPPPPSSSGDHISADPVATAPSTATVYHYSSPTKSGYTTKWAEAGAATQGVADSSVCKVHTGPPKTVRYKKAAYAIFAGKQDSAKALVIGVNNSIFRGYATIAEAQAAFAHAESRGWTRVIPTTDTPAPPIPHLPLPANPAHNSEVPNPLHGSYALDDRRFVVYRGITPGIYRSHLRASPFSSSLSSEPMKISPPPLKSKFTKDTKEKKPKLTKDDGIELEILRRRHRDRNEKSRLRMAKKRAELKGQPTEEAIAALEKEREYQAKYRAQHREMLRLVEKRRRHDIYKAVHGEVAYQAYLRRKLQSRRTQLLATEPYHSGDEVDELQLHDDYLTAADGREGSSRESSIAPSL
ncbi:hypothetical protein R3P38DRAFT_3224664 [Favolaschia claudopus]|uniref:Uncharacterized protein n=1 Tax=Favolaschia claudopus TaxID=2862362 RepID=A0AAV9ZW50_9AGAR